MANIINTAVGLAVGLVTGFCFERRSTQSTCEHNREFEAEIASLRTSIYSVGGGTASPLPEPEPAPSQPLSQQVLFKARAIQNADVGGHEILPVSGHETARWWPTVLPLAVSGSALVEVLCLGAYPRRWCSSGFDWCRQT